MGTTPVFAFRFPELTDSPNSPTQVQNLALDIEAKIAALLVLFTGTTIQATGMPTASDAQATAGTTSSTTYTSTLSGGTACVVVFVAPPSGIVLIHNDVAKFNSGSDYTYCDFEIRTGSSPGGGTQVRAPSDNTSIYHTGTAHIRSGVTVAVTGLTPGSTYHARQLFKVLATSTATFNDKRLTVTPQI